MQEVEACQCEIESSPSLKESGALEERTKVIKSDEIFQLLHATNLLKNFIDTALFMGVLPSTIPTPLTVFSMERENIL
jgi:hypothetical protein